MTKSFALKFITISAMISIAGHAYAQSGDDAADGVTTDAGDLALGTEVGAEVDTEVQPGQTYVAEVHGDWQQRCVKAPEGEKDVCQLYQLLSDEAGNAVAEISVFGLPSGQQAAAGATIITPLETLLTQQLTIKVDNGASKRYPYTFCAQNGCYARVGFTQAEVNAFKAGNQATMSIVPAAAPDEKVNLTVSLSGFTAGFDAVNAFNAVDGNE